MQGDGYVQAINQLVIHRYVGYIPDTTSRAVKSLLPLGCTDVRCRQDKRAQGPPCSPRGMKKSRKAVFLINMNPAISKAE